MHESVSANYLATLRGRLGWTFGSFLVYGTGGLAITDLKHEMTVGEYGFAASAPCAGGPGDNFCQPTTKGSKTVGVTVGGGMEWAFANNWSLKGEYLYVDFGTAFSQSPLLNGAGTAQVGTNALTHNADLTAHIARAGINYRF